MSLAAALSAVLAIGLITYVSRTGLIVFLADRPLPANVTRALRYVGPAVLSALTVNLIAGGQGASGIETAEVGAIAAAIAQRFDDLDFQHDIGDIELNISGCINACGHHHVGSIGVLGVDKDGSEWYQVSIGGAQGNNSAIGKIIGPSFAGGQMPEVVARLLQVYVQNRFEGERFAETAQRLGIAPFKEHVYATPIAAGELVGEDHA